MAGNIDNVKMRIRSAIPTGETAFDADITEALNYATNQATEWFNQKGVAFTAAAVVVDGIEDMAAGKFVTWHRDEMKDEVITKGMELWDQGKQAIMDYLSGTQKKKNFLGVNPVDSSVV